MTDTTEDLTTPETEPETEQTLDEMLAEALPAEETTPPVDDPEAKTEPTETPAEEPAAETETRKFTVKLDHEEREIDFDVLLSTEEGRAELKDRFEKGYGFDRAMTRAKQESQEATLRWFKERGYEPSQVPGAPGGWEVKGPQAATPAAITPEPDAKPDPAVERAELERIATFGVEDDPAAQVKALRRLSKMDVEEAVAKQSHEFQDWRAEQDRGAQEMRARAQREIAETNVRKQVREAIVARAKSFEGPDQARQAERIMDLAMHTARIPGNTMEQVLSIVTGAADDFDARKQSWLDSLAKQTPPKDAPPSLDGAPSGAPTTNPTEGLEYKTDEDWDTAIAASR